MAFWLGETRGGAGWKEWRGMHQDARLALVVVAQGEAQGDGALLLAELVLE